MDTPPIPKPRSTFWVNNDPTKQPVPLPRSKIPINNERVSASDIFRTISSKSKQISEDVAHKVSNSAKTANEKIEKKMIDGSKFAKGTFEKTISTSRAVRDSVARSVIDGTKTSFRLRKSKRNENFDEDTQRCVSMPVVDVSLFDNIQFHSPLLEQKGYPKMSNATNNEMPSLNLNSTQFDDLSLFSTYSDSNTDTVSNFSFDNKESCNQPGSSIVNEQLTYDTPKTSRTNSIVNVMDIPEVPERRKKRDSNLSIMRQNTLYENWNLPQSNSTLDTNNRPSISTILEFDPLSSSPLLPKYEGISNELLLLESFLIGDTYGSIEATDSVIEENFEEYGEVDYFNPPAPPERLDSLLPSDTDNTSASVFDKERNCSWFVEKNNHRPISICDAKPSTSVMQKFSNILKFDSIRQKSLKNNNSAKVGIVEKPPVNSLPVPYYCGILTKIVSGVVEDLFKKSETRFCVLSDQKLMCYTDPTNCVLKEAYVLDNIYSIQIVLPLSSSTTNNSYCLELAVSTNGPRNTPRKVLFSCSSAAERRNWAHKIVEHLTSNFPTKYMAEFTRCGWCYLKEGVSGEWCGAWVMLIRRVLVYYTTASSTIQNVDLRKTRCVVTQVADEETIQSCPSNDDHNLVLDCPHATIYLRFPYERELKGWRFMVKLAAHNNGAHLHHQQLTKEDVPAIVDKCLSFIYAHGSLSEGIYRRAGSNTVLAELLARFRRDAWSVQLSPGQHSEHDVAGVLKRFFRDLPEPLIPQEKQNELIAALRIEDEACRHAEYRNVMTSLPIVARNTSRKLFAHLHFLHTMAESNKMTAENLASIWGPNIMPGVLTTNELQTAWSSKEMFVVRDLITNFESVWEPTEAESRREAAVRRVLMRVLSSSAPASPKAAGDLKTWVYVKDKSTCYQITLTPSKTSADICIELSDKANMDSHLLMLEEVICNDSLNRIIHVDEVVLDVVLRWSYWDEEDRKDNYLIVTSNKILNEMESLRHTTSLVCGELRYANETTKWFKLHMFEVQNSKLCYFKDKQGSQKIDEWNVKDIIWYTGYEPKRNPQMRWALTFIPRKNKQKRSKDRPYFGCTIAGAITEDKLKWMTAMMFSEHANILPTPRLVIT